MARYDTVWYCLVRLGMIWFGTWVPVKIRITKFKTEFGLPTGTEIDNINLDQVDL